MRADIVFPADRLRIGAVALGAAVLTGGVVAYSPRLAAGLAGFALLVVLAFYAPVLHLVLTIATAVIVPPEVHFHYNVADAFVISGLARAGVELMDERLESRRLWATGAVIAFLALACLQYIHGVRAGIPEIDVRAELRVLLPISTFLLALSVVEREKEWRRLIRGLVLVGLFLGAWGIAQWTLHLNFAGGPPTAPGTFTTGGSTVGLYAFPVAIVLAGAALGCTEAPRGWTRAALVGVVALNMTALAFTFERTFWPALIVGVVYLAARSPWRERVRLAIGVPVLTLGVVVALSALAPAELNAVRDRVVSIFGYENDVSATYRAAEGALVLKHIDAHPVTGEGLGASMYIGRPGTTVQPKSRRYAESAYLWLAWKFGLPAAAILWAVLAFAAGCRQTEPSSLRRTVKVGSQSALVMLAVAATNWNIFDSVAGTATLGVLAALALAPARWRPAP